jgi:hypothetical protein
MTKVFKEACPTCGQFLKRVYDNRFQTWKCACGAAFSPRWFLFVVFDTGKVPLMTAANAAAAGPCTWAWTERSLVFGNVVGVKLGVRPVVPFDHQGRQPFLRSPHMVGHDSDGVLEPHDLTHALDGLGGRIRAALDEDED